jgi:antitoxin MazE
MRTRVQKWGNSLAVRIPSSFAVQAGIDEDSYVELALAGGKLVLSPVPASPIALETLLAGITDTNIHSEVDTGDPRGNEAW